jgi:hypothetical protein
MSLDDTNLKTSGPVVAMRSPPSFEETLELPDQFAEFHPSCIKDADGDSITRYIFGSSFDDPDMVYSQFERDQVSLLDVELGETRDILKSVDLEETQKMRFIQGCHFDIPLAAKSLREFVAWRQSHPLPCSYTPPSRDGPMYWSGRDKEYRPILTINSERIQLLGDGINLAELIINCLNYFLKKLIKFNKIEQLIVLIDLNNISYFYQIPYEQIQSMITILTSYFRGRLFKLFFINTPFLFYSVFNLIRAFIPIKTLNKIEILNFDFMNHLLNYIQFDQIDPNIIPKDFIPQKTENLSTSGPQIN